jgi:hypothetical protein
MKMIVMRSGLRAAVAGFAALALITLAGCGDSSAGGSSGKLDVVASFYPLEFIAKSVGGDAVNVTTLTAPGVEPHDLELTPKQVGSIADAKLIVFEKGLQPAVDEAIAQNAKDAGFDVAPAAKLEATGADFEEHEEGDAAAPTGGTASAKPAAFTEDALDPHFWLDPVRYAAVAAGVIALRAYPLTLSAVAAIAGWRRGLVVPLATRRAARGRTSAAVLLTLVATASVAGFSSACFSALDRAAQAASWEQVGAPFLVRSAEGELPESFDPAAVGGVAATAPASVLDTNIGGDRAALIALDTAGYQSITAGTPADRHLPAEMTMTTDAPADGVLPAVASSNSGLGPGTATEIRARGKAIPIRVVALTDSFPLAEPEQRFLIVSRPQLASAVPAAATPPNAFFIDAPASAGAAIAAALAAAPDTDPEITVVSRAEFAANVASTPVARAVSLGLAASAIVAAAYAALAIAAALVLSSSEQRTETAYLRILGLTRGQRLRLIFTEHVPAAIVAGLAGLVLGVGLFQFVRPGLGLATIMAGSAEIALSIEPQQLLALFVAALLIVIPAWALAAFAQREPDPAAAVREGNA